MEPQPPEVLADRYEVGAAIGDGGMGVVYSGVDRRLGRQVAVKLLRRDLGALPDARRRFEEEARAAAGISHPAVVTVFDSGIDGETAFLVMECLPGRTLADELGGGPLSERRLRDVAIDLLGALAAAHALGIIHRDVKPGNVLLAEHGRVKLTDFGIAKTAETSDHTATGLIVGTASYLAPERLAGEPATPASDLYSLGVVLYEAATGANPFRGDTPIAVAHAVYTTGVTPLREQPHGFDPRLAAAVDRAMSKDPHERFGSAGEMLDAILGEDPTSEVTAPAARVPTLPLALRGRASTATKVVRARFADRRRRRWLVGGAIALPLLLVLLLMLAASGDGDDAPTTPTATSPGAEPLPQPLDDAITRLERAVNE